MISTNLCIAMIFCCAAMIFCCIPMIFCCVPMIFCCVPMTFCCVPIIFCYVPMIFCCVPMIFCCVPMIFCCVPLIFCCVPMIFCCVPMIFWCSTRWIINESWWSLTTCIWIHDDITCHCWEIPNSILPNFSYSHFIKFSKFRLRNLRRRRPPRHYGSISLGSQINKKNCAWMLTLYMVTINPGLVHLGPLIREKFSILGPTLTNFPTRLSVN